MALVGNREPGVLSNLSPDEVVGHGDLANWVAAQYETKG